MEADILIQKKWLSFIGIALLSFGCYLDYTVVNIALPTIQKELHANLISLQWVMNIYFLALCILATIMGRLGDLYGRRFIFYVGIIIFAFASLLAGFSATIFWLIVGRLLQGVGAAIVFPLGPSLLPASFPLNERNKAIALLGSTGGIALALGPVLGGLIVTYWGWRWIFFINIPIIFLGFLFSWNSVYESTIESVKSFLDWKGMIFIAFTMGSLILGLLNTQQAGWLNPMTLIYFFVTLISAFCLIQVEKKQNNPLINFNDFSNVMFYGGAMLCFLAGLLSAVALLFDPLYLEIIRGHSPQTSGLILFSIPLAVLIFAVVMGWLATHFGIIHTILLSVFIAFLSGLLQLFFIDYPALWYIIFSFIVLGIVWAAGNTIPIIAAQTAVEPARISVATGTMITMFNIGGSLGLAISVVVYHFFAMKTLTLSSHAITLLEKLIANPATAMQTAMNQETYDLFNTAFMHGFSGAMGFIVVISTLIFFSILINKWINSQVN